MKKETESKQIPNDRNVFIAGKTRSGKTWLAGVYLAGYDNVICLDTKGLENWSLIPDVVIFEHFEDLEKFGEGKAIYRPSHDELNPEYYNKFFKWIYERGNTIVWIDEVMSICQNSSQLPEFYKACLTRGNAWGVSCWSLTQRPRSIPLAIMSESNYFFIFDLNLEDDRKRINEFIGSKKILEMPSKVGGKYSFWYYDYDMEQPMLAKLKQ